MFEKVLGYYRFLHFANAPVEMTKKLRCRSGRDDKKEDDAKMTERYGYLKGLCKTKQ